MVTVSESGIGKAIIWALLVCIGRPEEDTFTQEIAELSRCHRYTALKALQGLTAEGWLTRRPENSDELAPRVHPRFLFKLNPAYKAEIQKLLDEQRDMHCLSTVPPESGIVRLILEEMAKDVRVTHAPDALAVRIGQSERIAHQTLDELLGLGWTRRAYMYRGVRLKGIDIPPVYCLSLEGALHIDQYIAEVM